MQFQQEPEPTLGLELEPISNGVSILTPEELFEYPGLMVAASNLLISGIETASHFYPAQNIRDSLRNYSLDDNASYHPTFSLWKELQDKPEIQPFLAVELAAEEVLAVAVGKIFEEGNNEYRAKRLHVNWVVSQTGLKDGNPLAKGSATRVYSLLETYGKATKCDLMSAAVVDINKPSLKLHEKFGFTKIPNTPEMAASGLFMINGSFKPSFTLSGLDINGAEIASAKLEYYWKHL